MNNPTSSGKDDLASTPKSLSLKLIETATWRSGFLTLYYSIDSFPLSAPLHSPSGSPTFSPRMSASISDLPATAAAEIVTSRFFPYPRDLVFEAFHHPDHLMHWWGPEGFTNTFHEFHPVAGGGWRFTMHSPAGADYHNASDFIEVVKPERVVFVHLHPVHCFQMTMQWAEEGAGTRLTWRMCFEDTQEIEKLGDFIQKANEENMDRLETHLQSMPTMPEAGRTFLISLNLKASRQRVFEAWTQADLVAQWWGPHAFTNPECQIDLRPGGAWRIVMQSPDDRDFPISGVFQDIVPNEKVVTSLDCSEHPPEWHDLINPNRSADETNPAGQMQQTVIFTGNELRTTLTVRVTFESQDIYHAFIRAGIHDGWNESLESLAGLLERGH